MTPRIRSEVPRLVRQRVERDGIVQQAVARGIVNFRGLARWMLRDPNLAATEHAVLNALRRMDLAPTSSPFATAYQVIAASHLNVRSAVAQLRTGRTRQVQERMVDVVRCIDFERGEILYYTQGEGGIKILVDEANVSALEEALGGLVNQVTRNLAAISVVQPGRGIETPGILSLLSQSLALLQINIVDAVFGLPEYIFFVRMEDTLPAYQALERLIADSHAIAAGPLGK